MVEAWVRNLVLVKTFIGLRFQEAILKKIAGMYGVSYRMVTTEEEAKGIDGYLGTLPVSIKPDTYDTKPMLPENIAVQMVKYAKRKEGLELEFDLSEVMYLSEIQSKIPF
jgi:hypothetical protein